MRKFWSDQSGKTDMEGGWITVVILALIVVAIFMTWKFLLFLLQNYLNIAMFKGL